MSDATDNLTPETFDLLEVVSGIAYPEDEIVLYLDEVSLHALAKAREIVDTLEGDEAAKVNEKIKALEAAIEENAYTFNLKGVSPDFEKEARKSARSRYPDRKQDVQGFKVPVPTEEQNDYFEAIVLAANIQSIRQHRTGAVIPQPDVDTLQKFLARAPRGQANRLVDAINGLKVDSAKFEAAIGDDFLAKP